MYPTSQTFKRWASHATVSELSDVLAICVDELRTRVGPSDFRNVLREVGAPLDEGAI